MDVRSAIHYVAHGLFIVININSGKREPFTHKKQSKNCSYSNSGRLN